MQAQHSVKVKETCTTIARLYKVPPFDLFNRNKSKGCCHVTCNGPPGSKDWYHPHTHTHTHTPTHTVSHKTRKLGFQGRL